MNELQAVVNAYAMACVCGERAALATVVSVTGSAYRRPGARMLISESGHTTGSISGGCLERDVVERANAVLETGTARIIEYDTRGDEEIVWGLGLGCNGVVRILLEGLRKANQAERALHFIAACLQARKSGVSATVIGSTEATNNGGRLRYAVGERFLFDDELDFCGQPFSDECLLECIRADAGQALMGKGTPLRAYEIGTGRVEIFFDVIAPPRALVIFGAEPDALPVLNFAQMLGWHVTLVDTHAREMTLDRFSKADAVVLCRAEDVAASIALTPDSSVVVMTHNYPDDVVLMKTLLQAPVSYLGWLGPKQRTAKLLKEAQAGGIELAQAQLERLHNPVGMDIGAETAEEIALAIIAEIKAATAAHSGGFLRDRAAAIHDDGAISEPLAARQPAARAEAAKASNRLR